MTGNGALSPNRNVILQDRRAGYAHLGGYDAMPPDPHVVRYLHKIIELRSVTDDSVAPATAIDRAVSPDFHIVADNDSAKMGDFDMPRSTQCEPEAVLADASSRFYNCPFTDVAPGKSHAGADRTIPADDNVRTQHGMGTDGRSISYDYPVADDNAGIKHDTGSNLR